MKGGKTALYQDLKRKILTLELPPDEDLDESRISEEYGISRTPVRDVFRQLAGEGYIDIRENKGARVVAMNQVTLRDFFLVAPLIYEAVGRLAVQNFRQGQMQQLVECQRKFRDAIAAEDPETMVVQNNAFHALIGDMAGSAFLKPSLNKLLIDHARIGYTFFRPTNDEMRENLATSCRHHDQFIEAIAEKDEATVVRLVSEHWELSRRSMELFIAPRSLTSEAVIRLGSEQPPRKQRRSKSVAA